MNRMFICLLCTFASFVTCTSLLINDHPIPNQNESLIIPKELGNYFEEDDYSTTSCIYLQYLNLTMFTLNNFTLDIFNNQILHFCTIQNDNTSTYLTDSNNVKVSNISTYIKHNEVHVQILNESILKENQTDTYILRCLAEGDDNSLNNTDFGEGILYIKNTHCFVYKIQNFLLENNSIFSNLLILSGVVILFFGNAYPKSSIIITCIYILFYSVQLLFDLMQFNALGKRKVDIFYWGLLIIVLILGPFLGVLITLNAKIFKFAMGFFGGYLGFKMLLYYPILLKFNNPVVFNQYLGVLFHVIIGIALGIAFIFIKNTKLCMWIATSIVGSYMFIVGLSLYAGGFLNEMYAASLARCKDFAAARKYLNRGITWFYFVWFVLLGVFGVFFQNWKGALEMMEEKPIKKKQKQELDIGAKNYQLMDKSSIDITDDED